MPTIKDLKTYLKRFKDKNCPKLTGLKKDELTRIAYKYGYTQAGSGGVSTYQPKSPDQAPPTKRKPNAWLEYVKQVKAKNPSMAYKNVMKLAKETYKKGQPTTSASKQEEKQREQKTKEESNDDKIKRFTDERDNLESEIKKLNKIIDDENTSAKEAGKARDKKMPLLRKKIDIIKQIKELTKLKAPAKETPAKKVYKKTDPVIIEREEAPKRPEEKVEYKYRPIVKPQVAEVQDLKKTAPKRQAPKRPEAKPAPTKTRKPNAWIEHLKAFRAKNPSLSYKEAMKQAKETYKKDKTSTPKPQEEKKEDKRELKDLVESTSQGLRIKQGAVRERTPEEIEKRRKEKEASGEKESELTEDDYNVLASLAGAFSRGKKTKRGKGLRKPRTYGGGLSRDAHHKDVMTRGHVRY